MLPEPLYSILTKLDVREPLSDFEVAWLLEHDFEETLKIHEHQEDERKAIVEFSDLKAKIKLILFQTHLFLVRSMPFLKKLKEKQDLENSEFEWFEQQKLTQLIAIDRNRKDVKLFKELKAKYQATQYKTSAPSSKLFLILKNILTVRVFFSVNHEDGKMLKTLTHKRFITGSLFCTNKETPFPLKRSLI